MLTPPPTAVNRKLLCQCENARQHQTETTLACIQHVAQPSLLPVRGHKVQIRLAAVVSGADPSALLLRTIGTGPGAGRTTWRPRGHGTPGGSRRTRSPSGLASWRRRTPRSAWRWRTCGRSWAAARTFWLNMRRDTGRCEPRAHLATPPNPVSLESEGQCVSTAGTAPPVFSHKPLPHSPPVWFWFCRPIMSSSV